jgi:hypothetical protein
MQQYRLAPYRPNSDARFPFAHLVLADARFATKRLAIGEERDRDSLEHVGLASIIPRVRGWGAGDRNRPRGVAERAPAQAPVEAI